MRLGIRKSESLLKAEIIVSLIDNHLRLIAENQLGPEMVHQSAWNNGREDGFRLSYHTRTSLKTRHIAIAQNRNSDDIVVYHYENADFQTGLPQNDSDWENRKYFRYDSFQDAADYIIDVLCDVSK